jgi:hypothetical protein
MTENQKDILNQPIEALEISDELKALLKEKGFRQLKTVLGKNITDLRNKKGLSFEQELELYKLVEMNGLEGFWREG